MKFVTIRILLLTTLVLKSMLFHTVNNAENIITYNENSENQKFTLNKLEKDNDVIFIENKLNVAKSINMDGLKISNSFKEKGFNLSDLVYNLDTASKLITNFKAKTLSNIFFCIINSH